MGPRDLWQDDPEDQNIVDAGNVDSESVMTATRNGCWRCCCRLSIVLFLAACVGFVTVDVFTNQYLEKAARIFLDWVAFHPVKGVLAVTAIFAVATVLFMPAAVLTMGAGFAFHRAFDNYQMGVFLGSIVSLWLCDSNVVILALIILIFGQSVFCGAVLGSITAFLLGRFVFRETVTAMASRYPLFRAVDRALRGNGLKIMFLLRLSPLIPYNALDYISGVTSIPLWSYTLAMVGMIPGTVMFVAMGATASSLLSDGEQWSEENRFMNMTAVVTGIMCAVGGVAVASYYSKIELEKILESERNSRRSRRPARGSPYPSRENIADMGAFETDNTLNLHDLGDRDPDSELRGMGAIT